MFVDNFREVTSLLERLLNYLESGVVIDASSSNVALESTLSNIYTKADAILTELKLKADLTETQPVNIVGSSGGGHITNTNISNVSATQISGTSHACIKAWVTSPSTNTDYIAVGFSTVTLSNGILLSPGESIEIPVNNTNLIYAISTVNGEDISVTYFN